MTNNEIRITVAELCGWIYRPDLSEKTPWFDQQGLASHEGPPNYPSSLDACAEFERTASNDYWSELEHITCDQTAYALGEWSPEQDFIAMCKATPLQRCEAFLRLHGKWKD